MIQDWLRNPWETALVAILAAAGALWPASLAAAGLLFAALEIAAGLRSAGGPRWWPSWWPRTERTLTLLYDSNCVLCTRSKKRLEGWRTAPHMRMLALSSPEARALVPGMEETAYLGALHVMQDGRVYSGHEGWFRIMRLAPFPLALLAMVTPRAVARPLYAWVARNRYRWFGKVCDSESCQVHPPRPR